MPVEIDVDHVARLARLALTAEERDRLRAELGVILEHAAKVGEVATADVPPTASAVARANVFRPDDPGDPVGSIPRDDVLANAPDREGDRFRVPRIVEVAS